MGRCDLKSESYSLWYLDLGIIVKYLRVSFLKTGVIFQIQEIFGIVLGSIQLFMNPAWCGVMTLLTKLN